MPDPSEQGMTRGMTRRKFLQWSVVGGVSGFTTLRAPGLEEFLRFPFSQESSPKVNLPETRPADPIGYYKHWTPPEAFSPEQIEKLKPPDWFYLGPEHGLLGIPVQAINPMPDGSGFWTSIYGRGIQGIILTSGGLGIGQVVIPSAKLGMNYSYSLVNDREGFTWVGGQGAEVGGKTVVKIYPDGDVEYLPEKYLPTIGALVNTPEKLFAIPLWAEERFLGRRVHIFDKKREAWSESPLNKNLLLVTDAAKLPDGRIAVPCALGVEIYDPETDSLQTCSVLRSNGTNLLGARSINVLGETVLLGIDPPFGMEKTQGGVVVLNSAMDTFLDEIPVPPSPPPGPRIGLVSGCLDSLGNSKVWAASRGFFSGVYGATPVNIEGKSWELTDPFIANQQVQALKVTSDGVLLGTWSGVFAKAS